MIPVPHVLDDKEGRTIFPVTSVPVRHHPAAEDELLNEIGYLELRARLNY